MKIHSRILIPCSVFTVVLVAGCPAEEKQPLVGPVAAALAGTPVEPAAGPVDATPVAVPQWSDLRTAAFADRAKVLAGLAWIEQAADRRISDFKARRVLMKNDPLAWDQAMRLVASDRAYLRSMAVELAAATGENWADRKEKVGQALEALDAAFVRVERSTTS